MATEKKEGEGSSTAMVAVAALLALGAAGVVWYVHEQAGDAEARLLRTKDEYRKMVERMKKPVEDYYRQKKGKPEAAQVANVDLMTFLDKKARESQIPPGLFNVAKNADGNVGPWKESSFTVTLSATKELPMKRNPVVDFLRRVEAENRSTKAKNLQMVFSGDDFKSATITFSQFQQK